MARRELPKPKSDCLSINGDLATDLLGYPMVPVQRNPMRLSPGDPPGALRRADHAAGQWTGRLR
jgi:hypothetical protein